MKDRKKRGFRIVFTLIGVLAVVLIGLFSFYMLWERAPDLEPVAPTAKPIAAGESEKPREEDAGLPFDTCLLYTSSARRSLYPPGACPPRR